MLDGLLNSAICKEFTYIFSRHIYQFHFDFVSVSIMYIINFVNKVNILFIIVYYKVTVSTDKY